MKELTKEEQIQAIYDLKVGYTLGHADIAMLKAMARQLLASMEQEPVAWRWRWSDDAEGCWRYTEESRETRGSVTAQPLYAAPQLPQPTVDQKAVESLATDLMKRIDKITGERHSVATLSSLRVSIVEACGAAMLQGAEPVQGWIPCSERMPLTPEGDCEYQDVEVQAFDGEQVLIAHYAIGSKPNPWGAWVDTYSEITHWQPLAAAPQQEVTTDNTAQQFESLGFVVTSDERKMELPRCSKHPETELQAHPFEQLLSYPPQPVMYCPLCKPSVAEWVARDKKLRAR